MKQKILIASTITASIMAIFLVGPIAAFITLVSLGTIIRYKKRGNE